MPKLNLATIGSRYASVAALNSNFDKIEAALENTVSRDGTSPNEWLADQDANDNSLLNLRYATQANEAVPYGQMLDMINAGASGIFISQRETLTATEGQTLFSLSTVTYTPGINNLMVFVNGSKQSVALNYAETSSTSVTFVSGLNNGDVVEFITNQPTTTVQLENLTYSSVGSYTAIGGEYSVTSPVGEFLLGQNNLKVFRNGVFQHQGSDYNETSASTIQFVSALEADDKVVFVKNEVGSAIDAPASAVGYVPAGTGAVATNVQAKLREFVSVKDFGAVGDGVTDDTSAIQAAFDTGKSVYLPAGTYIVSNTLSLPSNVVVSGDGKSTVIQGNGNTTVLSLIGTVGTRKSRNILRDLTVRRTNGVTGSPTLQPIHYRFADDCRIENVVIDGGQSTYPGALALQATRNIKVTGCDFIEGASLVLSSSDDTTSGTWGENNVIANCRVTGYGTTGQGFDALYNKNIIFDNCVASGIGSTYGCGFLLEYEIQGAVLNNCISYGNVRSGFYLEGNVAYGVKNVSLNNCIAYSNGEAGITGDANFINISVTGGAYYSNTGTFVGGSGHGMAFSANSGVSIHGALIHSNAAAGISWVSNPYKCTITGCQIRDNTGHGIYFTGTPSVVEIVGNTINGNTGGSVAGWIETAGTWDNGPWVSWTPSWYKNDNATGITVSSQSAYFKRIGNVVHYSVYAAFSGTPDGTTYMSIPIEGGWPDGSTSDRAQQMRGTARGVATSFAYVTGVYDNDRVRITPTATGDTSLWVCGTYEIA